MADVPASRTRESLLVDADPDAIAWAVLCRQLLAGNKTVDTPAGPAGPLYTRVFASARGNFGARELWIAAWHRDPGEVEPPARAALSSSGLRPDWGWTGRPATAPPDYPDLLHLWIGPAGQHVTEIVADVHPLARALYEAIRAGLQAL